LSFVASRCAAFFAGRRCFSFPGLPALSSVQLPLPLHRWAGPFDVAQTNAPAEKVLPA
jgi:hypothetical protein